MKHPIITIAVGLMMGCHIPPEMFTPEENKRFIRACIMGDITTVKKSIADGLNVDVSDQGLAGAPLCWAIWRDQFGVVKILLANGANVNLKQPSGSIDAGMTPLDQAAKHGKRKSPIFSEKMVANTELFMARWLTVTLRW